jgi:hypothetical protein
MQIYTTTANLHNWPFLKILQSYNLPLLVDKYICFIQKSMKFKSGYLWKNFEWELWRSYGKMGLLHKMFIRGNW